MKLSLAQGKLATSMPGSHEGLVLALNRCSRSLERTFLGHFLRGMKIGTVDFHFANVRIGPVLLSGQAAQYLKGRDGIGFAGHNRYDSHE
jgi:hypothetical protein